MSGFNYVIGFLSQRLAIALCPFPTGLCGHRFVVSEVTYMTYERVDTFAALQLMTVEVKG